MTTNNTTAKRPTATKQYKSLLAALDGDKVAALAAWEAHNNPAPKPQVAVSLVKDEAAIAKAKKKAAKKAKKVKALTVNEQVEALVENKGFKFARGRVYVTGEIVEASVRVLKGGSPEIVRTSGTGRITAVAIFRTDNGDAALQNLVG